MKTTTMKRTLALLLALVMMFGLYPISAIAYDVEDAEPETKPEETASAKTDNVKEEASAEETEPET